MIRLICHLVPMVVLVYRIGWLDVSCQRAEQQLDKTAFSANARRRRRKCDLLDRVPYAMFGLRLAPKSVLS